MKKKKRIKKRKKILKIILLTLMGLFLIVILIIYLNITDKKAKEISQNANYSFVLKNRLKGEEGFYRADIRSDLEKKFKNKKAKEAVYLYKIKGEDFYFEIIANKEASKTTFEISRLIDEKHKVHAKMNYKNIEKIEYRTGNSNHSTVIKLISDLESRYLVLTNNTYYFLGTDIQVISYNEEQFYYLSYNPKYDVLKTSESCSKEVKKSIDGFSGKDYYYRYGKINFLTDYYQKLASKTFTVSDRCEELSSEIK